MVFRSVSIIAVVLAASAPAADKTNSEQAFERLALLQGEWQGVADGVNTTLIYTLTANGSTLMEQCRPEKGHEMVTIFTVDGDHLTQEWLYDAKGKSGKNVFHFTRVRPRMS